MTVGTYKGDFLFDVSLLALTFPTHTPDSEDESAPTIRDMLRLPDQHELQV